MKRLFLIFLFLNSLILYSCEKETLTQIGFNSEITKDSDGITIMHVNKSVDEIHLIGMVIIKENIVNIELESPDKQLVFSRSIQSPDTLHVNKTFNAQKGFWKLRYSSKEATGAIDLHLWY